MELKINDVGTKETFIVSYKLPDETVFHHQVIRTEGHLDRVKSHLLGQNANFLIETYHLPHLDAAAPF